MLHKPSSSSLLRRQRSDREAFALLGATALVGAATLVTVFVQPLDRVAVPFELFYLAIIATSLVWGWRVGALTLFLSGAITLLLKEAVHGVSGSRWDWVLSLVTGCAILLTLEVVRRRGPAVRFNLAPGSVRDRLLCNETLLRDIGGVLPGLAFYVDREERIRFINTPHHEWLGRPAEQLVGESLEVILGELYSEIRELSRSTLQGRPASGMLRAAFPKAGTRILEGRFVPDIDAAGAVHGYFALLIDRTEVQHAREALETSESDFLSVFELAGSGKVVWDADSGRLIRANRKFSELTGYSVAELGSMSITSIVEPEGGEASVIWPTLLGRSDSGWRYDFRIRRRDGGFCWVASAGELMRRRPNGARRVMAVFQDITEQKRYNVEREQLLESERAARGEAERASRLKDEFLAILSHELRTPLNAILGWVQLVRRGMGAPEKLEEGLAVIERNAKNQAKLINDLLDMSRISSGKIQLDRVPVDVRSLVESAAAGVRPLMDGRALECDVPRVPIAVLGDSARLEQVITNLLSNAIKFTPAGGGVGVRVKEQADSVVITVWDTGQGIAAEFLPYVFERFRQADGSTTRRHGGLGLGLAIVKQLVEAQGGQVSVHSEGEGCGSQFCISMPRARGVEMSVERVEGESHSESRGTSFEGRKVLIVDDERDAREFLLRMFEECDAKVVAAGSVDEALEIVDLERPALVVSDIGMPERDGYDLIRELRRRAFNDRSSIPAIAVTAFARPEDRDRVLAEGYEAHVAKPVRPAQLLAVAHQVMRRHAVAASVSELSEDRAPFAEAR